MAKENYWQIRFDEADGRVVQRLAQVYGVDPKARGAIPAVIRQALRNEYARWSKEENMNATEAHMAAEEFTGVTNEDATVVKFEDGTYRVELTSDVTVLISPDGECELAE